MKLALLLRAGAVAAALASPSLVLAQPISTVVNGGSGLWDQDLYDLPQGGTLQVLRPASPATVQGVVFERGPGDMLGHRIVEGPDGRVRRLVLLEASEVPEDATEGRVGDRLYSRNVVGSTFILHRGPEGALLSHARLLHGGQEVEVSSRLLPGGDLLLFGSFHPYEHTVGLVTRVGPLGQTRWAHELPLEPPRGCDEGSEICVFSDLHGALVVGDEAILTGSFGRGRLQVGPHTVMGRHELSTVVLKVDLATGTIGWAALRPMWTTMPTLVPRMTGERPIVVRGSGSGAFLASMDLQSGNLEQVRRLRGLEGAPKRVQALGDGVAVLSSSRDGRRYWLEGFNRAGERTFRRDGLNFQSEVLSDGESVLVATPNLGRLAYPNFDGFWVERISATGAVLQRAEHRGVWRAARTLLHRRSGGGAWLSSIVRSVSENRLVGVDALAPLPPPAPPRVATRDMYRNPSQFFVVD